jgi:hypothetical protein
MQVPIQSFFVSRADKVRLIADASELEGFRSVKIGRYPVYLSILGNEGPRLFGPVKPQIDREGETTVYLYPQADKGLKPECEVHIVND